MKKENKQKVINKVRKEVRLPKNFGKMKDGHTFSSLEMFNVEQNAYSQGLKDGKKKCNYWPVIIVALMVVAYIAMELLTK